MTSASYGSDDNPLTRQKGEVVAITCLACAVLTLMITLPLVHACSACESWPRLLAALIMLMVGVMLVLACLLALTRLMVLAVAVFVIAFT